MYKATLYTLGSLRISYGRKTLFFVSPKKLNFHSSYLVAVPAGTTLTSIHIIQDVLPYR